MTEDDLGAPPANGTIVDSLAGGFNYLGNSRYYPKRHPINYRGLYVTQTTYLVDEAGNRIVDEAGNYIVVANEATVLRSQIDDIKAQHGKWAYLVRRREDDGAEQFKYARLLNVAHVRTLSDTNRIARLDLTFEAEGKPWRSTFGAEATTSLTANAVTGLSITTGGTEEVRDAVFTITATSTITGLAIVRYGDPNFYMQWTGSLTAGQSLVIDCGAHTVEKNGAEAYGGFSLYNGIHNGPDWMILSPSIANSLLIGLTGGPGNLSVVYFDQWA